VGSFSPAGTSYDALATNSFTVAAARAGCRGAAKLAGGCDRPWFVFVRGVSIFL